MSCRLPLLCSFTFISSTVAFGQDWFDAPRHFTEQDVGAIRLAADFDGDGDRDLAWVTSNEIRIASNDGAGQFYFGPVTISAEPLEDLTGDLWAQPRAGDVNGDGRADLVFGTNSPYPNGKLLLFVSLGGGAFAPVITIDLPDPVPPGDGGEIQAIALGNVDADPALEVATAHSMADGPMTANRKSAVTWFDWNGTTLVPMGAPLTLTGLAAIVETLAPIDVDSDGDSDLVAAAHDGGYTIGQAVILITAAGSSTLGNGAQTATLPYDADAADLDNDGDVDALVTGRNQCSLVSFTALVNQGFGQFAPVASTGAINELGCSWWASTELADWDGDGDQDAFLGFGSADWFRNDGANHFAFAGRAQHENSSAYFAKPAAVVDVDGDGRPDVIGPRSVIFNHGAPLADPPPPFSFPFSAPPFYALDQDGDGDLDLLNRDGDVGKNDGTGSCARTASFYPPSQLNGIFFLGTSAIGDFNGDGRRDVLLRRFQSQGMFSTYLGTNLFLGGPGGSFTDAGQVFAAAALAPQAPIEGRMRQGVDVDHDGDEDIPAYTGFFRNDGGGLAWTFVGGFTATDVTDVADVDHDGDVDFLAVLQQATTSFTLFERNDGGGVFSAFALVSSPGNTIALEARFLDVDADGDLDVVTPGKASSTALWISENVGGAYPTSPVDLASFAGNTVHFAVDDVDGDGLTDLVCDRQSLPEFDSREIELFRRSGPGLTFEPRRDWLADLNNGFLDVDGDGDVDAVGDRVIENRRFDGPSAGEVRQYGAGTPGTGGVTPVLGARGPLRPGSTTGSFRGAWGRGGAPSILFIGFGEAALPHVIPGGTLYVNPAGLLTAPIFLGGAPGAAGAGSFDVDQTPLLASLVGVDVFLQLVVIDAAGPGGVSSTQGLELLFGG